MLVRVATIIAAFAGYVIAVGSNSDVVELTDKTFDEELKKVPTSLVEFYAPWCGACKHLAPTYEKVADALKKETTTVHLTKIDCTTNEKTCQRFDVSGYPTLKIFSGNKFSRDYSGPRDVTGMTRYMSTEGGPPSRELKSAEEVDEFINHYEHAVVAFLTRPTSEIASTYHESVAPSLRYNYRFAHTYDKDALKKYYTDKVVVFQPPRLHTHLLDARTICGGSSLANEYDNMRTCVKEALHGPIGHRTLQHQHEYAHPLINVYWDVDYIKNIKGSNYWRNRLIKIAKKHTKNNGDLMFGFSSWNDFANELQEVGLKKPEERDAKPIVTARDTKNNKYAMQDEFSPENVDKFVEDFFANRLKPYLKSEPEQASNDAGVKVVVGSNFDKIVGDDTKDVLIEFYAPWCGHCKELVPIYDRLGETFKNEPNLIIAKMDATANDVPAPYNVHGYPTIYLKKRDDPLNPKKYEGAREYDEFVKYLRKNVKELREFAKETKSKKKLSKTNDESDKNADATKPVEEL